MSATPLEVGACLCSSVLRHASYGGCNQQTAPLSSIILDPLCRHCSNHAGWFYNPFDLSVKGIANTGVVRWGGKLLALYEVSGWAAGWVGWVGAASLAGWVGAAHPAGWVGAASLAGWVGAASLAGWVGGCCLSGWVGGCCLSGWLGAASPAG